MERGLKKELTLLDIFCIATGAMMSSGLFILPPFNFLYPSGTSFSETEKKLQCQKNQRVTKICQKKSTSVPSADRTCKYREMILGILKRLSDCE